MKDNYFIQLYNSIKYEYLKNNPLFCLYNSNIDINPHQVEAFLFGINSLNNGGAILADEVGLGKTIEASLIMKYYYLSNRKNILLIIPSSLRKQWQIELEEKFKLEAKIVEGYNFDDVIKGDNNEGIIICSYQFAALYAEKLKNIAWDLVIFDEAHKLRNVHKSNVKLAKKIYFLTNKIPKIMLTATPIQNTLYDIFGLVQFIDEKIFYSKKSFSKKFLNDGNYIELKNSLKQIIKRTLRKDVKDRIHFSSRTCITVDFAFTPKEAILYQMINNYLKREITFAIPTSNKTLMTMVIRKLTASSSYAVAETFQVLKNRLILLKESTAVSSVNEGLDYFLNFIDEDDNLTEDDNGDNTYELFDREKVNEFIQNEINEIDKIITSAESITTNSKGTALIEAVDIAFRNQKKQGIDEKVVIFTESIRTQKYIVELLMENGYNDEIMIFNGSNNDRRTKEIYRAWRVKNYGNTMYSRSIEIKNAIVDYFKHESKILVVTDAGSEGLNLQFCNTVINYDLPWNPQKIEQRIGRCHRYGQQNDVSVINLLNTENVADKRVYEILSEKLSLFNGMFGASDEAIGLLESGESFEKRVLDIYQKCSTVGEFNKEFNKLGKEFEKKRNKGFKDLKELFTFWDDNKKSKIYTDLNNKLYKYNECLTYTSNSKLDSNSPIKNKNYLINIKGNDLEFFTKGYICIGAILNKGQLVKPVLICKDEKNKFIVKEETIIDTLSKAEIIQEVGESLISLTELNIIKEESLKSFMLEYYKENNELLNYEKSKIENWKVLKKDYLVHYFEEIDKEIEVLKSSFRDSKDFKEKLKISKEMKDKESEKTTMTLNYHKDIELIDNEANKMVKDFESNLQIEPVCQIICEIRYITEE
ncbi:DISARM system SNF2-like helicase DrmD [Clostridium cibarium]|uniref:DEAD/DEAH box helicase n=1 Tax=Clostridium cibarium TaxID=2762247 RepID=A0ABR8PXR3_9CLOT|nr:DISARM system SNF2-like helicase DrmD [Clostridium cibarium]MBD7912946.1 DEAD/DEAH box helicase [Clostridium cibarium]